MAKSTTRSHDDASRAIIQALDLAAEYRALGLEITGRQPNAGGWLACRAIDREDTTPSAAINLISGYYTDLGGDGRALSLWDFAAARGAYPDWREARKAYAAKAGVALGRGRPAKNPADQLVFRDWNRTLAALWCQCKPGVTVEALEAAGAQLARYPAKSQTHQVIALPVYGPRLVEAEPVGWVIWHAGGRELPVWGKDGRVERRVKMKTVAGSESGLMGRSSLARLAVDREESAACRVIWKVEGPTDMLALWALIPPEKRDTGEHLVVCNSGGSTENVRPEIAEVFAGHVVYIIHDADKPGEAGAAKWCEALTGVAKSVRQVRLPYEVVENHGPDLRDWIREHAASTEPLYDTLLSMAEASPVFGGTGHVPTAIPPAASPNGQPPAADAPPQSPAADESSRRIVDAIALDVLGERESGNVIIFACHPSRRRTVEVRDPDRLTYARLLQIAGPPVAEMVTESGEEQHGRFTPGQIRNAICYLAGQRRLTDQALAGAGCWQAVDRETGRARPAVILVGAGEAAVWDSERPGDADGNGEAAQFTTVYHPRGGGRLLNLSESDPWYDAPRLAADLQAAGDRQWCERAIEETTALWDRWRWRDASSAPYVMTGLVLATWIQTLWEWRPQVAVTGESKTGKSTLFETLDRTFGGLAIRSSQSSAAGIRQRVQTSARVVLVDEFEDSKHRREILEMARAASRGDATLRGTGHQQAVNYILRHIFWVAMISLKMPRAADRNRWIELELLLPRKGDEGKLTTPPSGKMADLGRRLLAIAVRHGPASVPLAARLKAVRFKGVDSRLVESYAVPAAIWATACGMADTDAAGILGHMLAGIVARQAEDELDSQDAISDPRELLQAIGRAEIWVGKGERCTVSEALVSSGADRTEALERHGVAIVYGRAGPRDGESHPGITDEYLFLDVDTIEEKLLRGTRWENESLATHLCRITGAQRGRRRVAGRRPYGVLVPVNQAQEIMVPSPGAAF